MKGTVVAQKEHIERGLSVYHSAFIELERSDPRKKIVIDLDRTLVSGESEADQVSLREGASDLLKNFQLENIKVILWTSSTKLRTKAILEKFGLRSLFDIVITRENFSPGERLNTYDYDSIGIPENIRANFEVFDNRYHNMGKYLQFLGYPLLIEDGRLTSLADEGGFSWIGVDEFDPKNGYNTPLPSNLSTQIKTKLKINQKQ